VLEDDIKRIFKVILLKLAEKEEVDIKKRLEEF
jgi:hypothetical protein